MVDLPDISVEMSLDCGLQTSIDRIDKCRTTMVKPMVIACKQVQVKGSVRQCMVVKLRMQYCGEIFQESLETYETFLWCKFVQQECKLNL